MKNMNFCSINQFKIDMTTKLINTALKHYYVQYICIIRWFTTVVFRIVSVTLIGTSEESGERTFKTY